MANSFFYRSNGATSVNKMLLFVAISFVSCAVAHTDEQPDKLVADNLWQSQLYAPWRESWKPCIGDTGFNETCPFCSQIAVHEDDHHFILKRTDNFIILLNLFPYSKGHLLIVPYAHVENLKDLNGQLQIELMQLQIECIEILKKELHTESFNIGINLGKYSGASIPKHLHVQIVPRYKRERGFIQTISQVNIVSWDLKKLYEQLKSAFNEQKSLNTRETYYPSYVSTNHYGRCLRVSKDLNRGIIVATADFEQTDKEYIANCPSEEHKYVALMDVTVEGKAVWGNVRGNWKFCNHSCDPNCDITDKWEIVTNRKIKKGDELTTSYDAYVYNYPWPETWNFECKCNSKNCKKIIKQYRTDIIYPIKLKQK